MCFCGEGSSPLTLRESGERRISFFLLWGCDAPRSRPIKIPIWGFLLVYVVCELRFIKLIIGVIVICIFYVSSSWTVDSSVSSGVLLAGKCISLNRVHTTWECDRSQRVICKGAISDKRHSSWDVHGCNLVIIECIRSYFL